MPISEDREIEIWNLIIGTKNKEIHELAYKKIKKMFLDTVPNLKTMANKGKYKFYLE